MVLFRGPWRTQEGLPLGRAGQVVGRHTEAGRVEPGRGGGLHQARWGDPSGWAGLDLSPPWSHVQGLASGCGVRALGEAGKAG